MITVIHLSEEETKETAKYIFSMKPDLEKDPLVLAWVRNLAAFGYRCSVEHGHMRVMKPQ